MADSSVIKNSKGDLSGLTTLPENGPASPRITLETVVKTLHHLPPEYLPRVLEYIEFLKHRTTYTPEDPFEDDALWDAVQAEKAYRQKHPEDTIVCTTIEELHAALEDDE